MDGRSHSTISALAAIPAAIFTLVRTGDMALAISVGIGCGLVGQVLTPDLDIDDVTLSEWIIIRKLGPFGALGWLWVAYWWPYAWALPHRSILSHAPVISTALRVAYLLWWLPVLFAIAGREWPAIEPVIPAGLFVGLCLSDTLHWLADFVPARRYARRREDRE